LNSLNINKVNDTTTQLLKMSKLYSIIINNGVHTLINLKHVSRVDFIKDKNMVYLTMAHQKNSMWGSFLFFSGGENNKIEIRYDTTQKATDEFNKIRAQMEEILK
jgi:hypothetical protein